MKTLFKTLLTIAPVGLLVLGSGCAQLKVPINEKRMGFGSGVRTLGTTAETRLTVIKEIRNPANGKTTNVLMYAEPPPDVAQRIFEKLDLSGKASGSNGQVTGNAEFTMSRQLAREIAQLAKRSQGVILFRDFSFRLAEAYVNEAIDKKQYAQTLNKAFKDASDLVKKELEGNPSLSSTSADRDSLELLLANAADLKAKIVKAHDDEDANAKAPDRAGQIEEIVKRQTGLEWAPFEAANDLCPDKLKAALSEIGKLK